MKTSVYGRWAMHLGVLALAACVCAAVGTQRAGSQDPKEPPNFGSVKLTSGFVPDPFRNNKIVAGGNLEVRINNVKMKITRAPDFQLFWTAGDGALPLSFYVQSKVDTTLLIHMPIGGYVADDDSGGNLNPLITLKNPPSGRYDIWVGTFNDTAAPAVLSITELKVNTPLPK
jgi:hypothetical protein